MSDDTFKYMGKTYKVIEVSSDDWTDEYRQFTVYTESEPVGETDE